MCVMPFVYTPPRYHLEGGVVRHMYKCTTTKSAPLICFPPSYIPFMVNVISSGTGGPYTKMHQLIVMESDLLTRSSAFLASIFFGC